MKLAFMAAAWLLGVLIGLETSTPVAALLLLIGGSGSMGLAFRVRRLPVFPAVLSLLLLLGVWRGNTVAEPVSPFAELPLSATDVTLAGQITGNPEFSGSRVEFTLDLRAVNSHPDRSLWMAGSWCSPTHPTSWLDAARHLTSAMVTWSRLRATCAARSPSAALTILPIWQARE